MRRAIPILAAVSLSACGYVEAQVSALCQTLPRQTFKVPALPAGAPREVSLTKDFAFDITLEAPELQDLDRTVRFSYVAATVAGDTKDLAFVDHAAVTLQAPAGSKLTPLTFEWTRTEAAPTRVAVQREGLELGPWLDAGVLQYAVTFQGRVPEQDVTVDLEACADVTVRRAF